jgi:serine/threonine protein kinase
MPLESGQSLFHYRLTEKLGEGGMGVVWRATDTTLDRDVAIKVLPDSLSADPDRLARFEREAKLLAALDHPNLATVHGLHDAAGIRFLAMELIPGEELEAVIRRGPLPLDDALRIASQIAAALGAAHERGIVHRDLKPANVKITPEGKVKVLDLGLAKALVDPAGSGADLSLSPTLTAGATQAGVILGTASYMSPEQARGRPVDRRADVWAFGVILFEMLTGRRLFRGESVSDILAEVLKTEPDWGKLPDDTPAQVRRVLRRCLARDPERRLRDLGDARLELEETDDAGDAASATPQGTPTGPQSITSPAALKLAWFVALAAPVLVAISFSLFLKPSPLPQPHERLDLSLPGIQFAFNNPIRISPDGRRILYFKNNELWIRDLERLEPRVVPQSRGALTPFWSPDGQWIGFISEGRIWKVPADGGERVVISRITGGVYTGYGGDATWGEDGTIVFSTGWSGLLRVSADGGEASVWLPLVEGELDLHDPTWLPDARGVLFQPHRSGKGMDQIGVWDGTERRIVLELPGDRVNAPVYSSTGHIVFLRGGVESGVWALPFDLDSLQATGKPFPVISGAGRPTVARDGTIAAVRGTGGMVTEAVEVDATGQVVRVFGGPVSVRFDLSAGPQGKRAAYSGADAGSANEDIFTVDLATGNSNRLTYETGEQRFPNWSPDGSFLVYQCFDDIQAAVCVIPTDGSGSNRIVGHGLFPSVDNTGRRLIAAVAGEGGLLDLVSLDISGEEPPTPIVRGIQETLLHALSPDGRFLAYEDNAGEVFVTRYPGGEGKWQVATEDAGVPHWSRDGKRLLFLKGMAMVQADVDTSDGFAVGDPRPLFSNPDPDLVVGRLMPMDELPNGNFLLLRNVTSDGGPPSVLLVRGWAPSP